MTIVLQLIYRFSAIYIKILMDFFKNKDDDLKIYIEIQGTQNSQNNLEEKTCWRTHISQFQNLSQNSNNQDHIALAWGRHIDPGNRIEKPEMKPYMYGQLTFRRVPRQSNTKKKTVFSTNDARTTGYPCQRMNLDPYIILYTRINSKTDNEPKL